MTPIVNQDRTNHSTLFKPRGQSEAKTTKENIFKVILKKKCNFSVFKTSKGKSSVELGVLK